MTEPKNPGRVRVKRSAKRVRTYLGGELVADTVRPLLVWEVPYFPTYYLPAEDVRAKLVPTGATERSPHRGEAEVLDVVTGSATAPRAARRYPDSPLVELREAVRLDWGAMDEWLEEDEPVYTHPRDPYSRVDILSSSRHVRVELDGVVLAESHRPTILFETGLPPRYYLPMPDVRRELLRAGQRDAARGPGVDLPEPRAGEPEDRRAGLLLQRAGGPLRRRRPAGAPGPRLRAIHPLWTDRSPGTPGRAGRARRGRVRVPAAAGPRRSPGSGRPRRARRGRPAGRPRCRCARRRRTARSRWSAPPRRSRAAVRPARCRRRTGRPSILRSGRSARCGSGPGRARAPRACRRPPRRTRSARRRSRPARSPAASRGCSASPRSGGRRDPGRRGCTRGSRPARRRRGRGGQWRFLKF